VADQALDENTRLVGDLYDEYVGLNFNYVLRLVNERDLAEELTMKAHVQFEKMLAVYPSLDQVQRGIVDEHVSLCPACAKVRSAYQAMDEQVPGLVDSLPSTLTPRWSTLVRAERQPAGLTLWTVPMRVARVGLPVVLLLLLLCGLWLLLRFSIPRSPEIAETPSVRPSVTPAVMASRRLDALALRAREPRLAGAEKPRSSEMRHSFGQLCRSC